MEDTDCFSDVSRQWSPGTSPQVPLPGLLEIKDILSVSHQANGNACEDITPA